MYTGYTCFHHSHYLPKANTTSRTALIFSNYVNSLRVHTGSVKPTMDTRGVDAASSKSSVAHDGYLWLLVIHLPQYGQSKPIAQVERIFSFE